MKKIKLLILALLGITIIPTITNAYEISNLSNYNGKDLTVSNFHFFSNACLRAIPGLNPWILTTNGYHSQVMSNMTECPEGYVLGNYYVDTSHGNTYHTPHIHYLFYEYQGAYFRYIKLANEWNEWLAIFRTSMIDNSQTLHKFVLPSKTAYKYTAQNGKEFILTEIYFYHNQFFLYDPITRFWVSFLGKMKIENGIILAHPGLAADNLYFINFQQKKARSMTTTKSGALKWLLGVDVSKDKLESLQFTKSYSLGDWWTSFLPGQFINHKQWWSGIVYQEDIDYIAPNFNWATTQSWSVAENYNKCVSYYSDIKNLAYYSQKCWEDFVDEETQNRVKVDSWNGEWDTQTIIAQLTWANKNKCWRFANSKKQYKDKYGAEFWLFYKEFWKYARTPEAVDIQSLCKGIELEHSAPPYIGYSSWNLSSWKDFFSSLFSWKWLKAWLDEEDEKIMYSSWNVVYTIWSYKTDLSQLEALYNQCYNKIYSESSEDVRIKTSYCNLYNSEKRRLSQKYASIDFASFWLVPFDARISQREAVANSWYLITYYNSVSSGFSSSLSEVGSKLFGFVQTPFLDGFDHWKFLSCQDSFSVPQFEIFAYIFFALIVFYLLKYL